MKRSTVEMPTITPRTSDPFGSPATSTVVKVDAVRVEDRARRDILGIDTLAASIQNVGLLHPIVVTPDLRLVAGGRRLEAVKALGWESVPATIANTLTEAADMLQAESDENTERLPLKPTEAADLARKIEDVLKPLAKERMEAGAKLAQGPQPKTRDVAAKAAGIGHETIRKVRLVQEVAEKDTTPEPVRELAVAALAEMDETGKVNGPAQRVREAVVEAVETDPVVRDTRYMHEFYKALTKAGAFMQFDAERIGRLSDQADLTSLDQLVEGMTKFRDKARRAASGLRLVEGGR